jgi:hypothetical protein
MIFPDDLEGELAHVFEQRREMATEPRRRRSVDHAMVVGQ